MSLFALLSKGHAVLEIASKALELYEEVVDLGDDNKPKTDERGNTLTKKQIRQVTPDEVFDFKVERETGVVKALTKAGQRVEGVLATADLAKAVLASDGDNTSELAHASDDAAQALLAKAEQEATAKAKAAAAEADDIIAKAKADAEQEATAKAKAAADEAEAIIAKAKEEAKALLEQAEKDAAATKKAPAKAAAK
ncbi:hypothetical protein LPA49_20290 [Pseudoalteromonas sp. MB41]|uniref:hypothetical protein n=1 Tax=Pseudoalteromonas sp. MB41 TaxID=2896366 RepID=UPI001E523D41|nr:hypothetical protein [Pseudoalteromonas sp. MB41]MCC9662887.1 hypothetical protein [Pseudoalteromonas sp. MB41]